MKMFFRTSVMKQINIVLIVAHAIITSNQHESFNQNQTISSSSPTLDLSFHSEDPMSRSCPKSALPSCPTFEPQHLRQREIRNANGHMDSAVRQMEMVARVTNGIALMQSIVNGTFDSETVFSELLRLGKLEPSYIKKIDVAAFETALDSMKGVELKDASEAEKFFNQLDAVRQEVEGMGSVADWNPDTFKNEIESLKHFSLALTQEVMGKVVVWNSDFTQLSLHFTVDDAKTGFSDLKKSSKDLASAISRLDSTKKLGFAFKTIQSATSGFSIVGKALNGIDAYSKIVQHAFSIVHADDKFAPNSENFNAIQAIASQVPRELSGILETILSFYKHRKSGASRKLKLTIAFPNGFSDLGLIMNDLKDGWLKKVVKSDRLRTALEPLESLEASLRVVADKFGSPDDQKLRRVAGMVQRIEDLRSVESSTSAAENIREYMKGFKASSGPGILSMSTILKEVRNVDAALVGLDNFVKTVFDSLKMEKNMKILQEIETFPVEFTTDAEAVEAVNKFKEDAEKSRFYDLTGGMAANLSIIGAAVRNSKNEILSKLGSFEAFKSDLAEFSPLFKTLQDNSELVMKMFRMIEWFRSPERNAVLSDVIGVVNIVKSTDGDLDSLKEKIAVINETRGNETKVLAVQEDLRDVSEVIGSSTEGVVKMRRLIDEPLVYDKKWIGIVEKAKQKVVSPLSPNTIRQLDQIGSIEQAFAKMDDQLGEWSRGVKEPSSSLLANHSDLFTSAAAKVQGVDIDFVAVSKAVESLQKSIPAATTSSNRKRAAGPDELSVLRSELDKFAAVGLQFTNYHPHFRRSEASLQLLDQFFSAFAKAVQPPKEPSRDRVDQGGNTTTTNATSLTDSVIPLVTAAPEESSWDQYFSIGVIVGGVVGVIVVVVIIGLLIYCCCCHRKREAEVEDTEESLIKENEGKEEDAEALRQQKKEAAALKQQNEEKEKEAVALKKQNEEREKEAVALKKQNEENKQKADLLEKQNVEKEEAVKQAQIERDQMAKQLKEGPPLEPERTQESERIRVTAMPFQMAKAFIDSIYLIVGHHSGLNELRKQGQKIEKAVRIQGFAAGLLAVCDQVMRGVDSETKTGKTKEIDKEFKAEIRVRGQILREFTKVELRNPPKGWFRTTFMHANVVTMPNNLKMILSQAPQKENKKEKKISTIDKFLWMIKENESQFVVMLCQFDETADGEKKNKCDKYFALTEKEKVSFDHSEVECLSKTDHAGGYIERKLMITFRDGSTHTFIHFQYTEWKDHFVPNDPSTVIAILKRVRESFTPVVVHCSAGIGRSGAFACVELGYQLIAQSGVPALSGILGQLRSMRCGAVQNVYQLSFVVIALIAYTLETASAKEREEVAKKQEDLAAAFQEMLASADERKLAGTEYSCIQIDSESDEESLPRRGIWRKLTRWLY